MRAAARRSAPDMKPSTHTVSRCRPLSTSLSRKSPAVEAIVIPFGVDHRSIRTQGRLCGTGFSFAAESCDGRAIGRIVSNIHLLANRKIWNKETNFAGMGCHGEFRSLCKSRLWPVSRRCVFTPQGPQDFIQAAKAWTGLTLGPVLITFCSFLASVQSNPGVLVSARLPCLLLRSRGDRRRLA